MTDDELTAIEQRLTTVVHDAHPCACAHCQDVRALIAEVRRLRLNTSVLLLDQTKDGNTP